MTDNMNSVTFTSQSSDNAFSRRETIKRLIAGVGMGVGSSAYLTGCGGGDGDIEKVQSENKLQAIGRKVAVFGDSINIPAPLTAPVTKSRAQFLADSPGFGFGFDDKAFGGQRLGHNWHGLSAINGASIFGGHAYHHYIHMICDADIVVIALGGNDRPKYSNGTEVPVNATVAQYAGASYQGEWSIQDYLNKTALNAAWAGKRVVILSAPYIDVSKLIGPGGAGSGATQAQGEGFAYHCQQVTNCAMSTAAGVIGSLFIQTHGVNGAPVADYNSTYDGMHPTAAYANAVNGYIAAKIKAHFGL